MRTGTLVAFFLGIFVQPFFAQQIFPIKMNKKWGLMDAEGQIVQNPIYDAVGEFKAYGYAVMQRNGGVGLLGKSGQEIVEPRYQDLKVLTPQLVSVLEDDRWKVIDLRGREILSSGYERVEVLSDHYLAFARNGRWGIVNWKGQVISEPEFDRIELLPEPFFRTYYDNYAGLIDLEGREWLAPAYDEVRVASPDLVFFKSQNRWGLATGGGRYVVPVGYEHYDLISNNFVRLSRGGKSYLYSLEKSRLLTNGEYDQYYAFSDEFVMVKRDRLLGLMDTNGKLVLVPKYDEIQPFGRDQFRVNFRGRWGIVDRRDELAIPFAYNYIAPLKGSVAIVIRGRKLGVINQFGEVIVPVEYKRIVPENQLIKAYQGEALTAYHIDQNGRLLDEQNFQRHFTIAIGKDGQEDSGFFESQYQLEHFEWFYSPSADKWGLRRLDDGSIQLEPTFDEVEVLKDLGFTVVGIAKPGIVDFERTSYRFELVYGLVNNEVGLPVTEIDLWDIRLSDFDEGLPLARCVFSNGRHGLINRIGKIVRRDFAYIGRYSDGLARVSMRGRLSGTIGEKSRGLERLGNYLASHLSSNYMLDYTQYDRQFEQEAMLICEDCQWGYVDTLGQMIIDPQFSFARDFVNEVGIVECQGKWGMVGKKAELLIPCHYDQVDFLENTDNRIIRIYKQDEKYGLIDTLGQMTVSLQYDEIGSFSEGRLAVRRNGMWGFVDRHGLEVIPCRFRAVSNFSEGLAAVKIGRSWGFIDKQGNVEIDFNFIRVGDFRDGLAWFFEGGAYGYIDQTGVVAIDPVFEKAHDFEAGVARVVQGQEFGLIDASGKYIMRPKYTAIEPFNQYGLAKVCYGNDRIRYGLIDKRGELVTTQSYREIHEFFEGMAAVKLKDGYGYVNSEGRLVIQPIYSKASAFSDGRAAVQKDGLCGYINKDGEELVQLAFSKCLDFEDGKAVVYKGTRKAGLIDSLGRYLIEPSIDRLYDFREGRGLVRDANYRFYYITEQASLYDGYYEKARLFQHGVAVVQLDGRWGIINQKGIEIIPPKYDKIEQFENGYAKVRIKGFNGLSNLKGEMIVQPDYEYISYAGEGLFRVEQGDKVGYFDMDGKWVWGLTE